ncbi:MAG: integrase [Gammaproteobacteria bacterium]
MRTEFTQHGIVLKLLLLTGVRRIEVALAEWKEVNLQKQIWDIPRSRPKSGKLNVVPLSPMVINMIVNGN